MKLVWLVFFLFLYFKGWEYTVEVSFLEIYNEIIRDLLRNDKEGSSLKIMQVDGKTNDVTIPGLTVKPFRGSKVGATEVLLEPLWRFWFCRSWKLIPMRIWTGYICWPIKTEPLRTPAVMKDQVALIPSRESKLPEFTKIEEKNVTVLFGII